MGNDSDHPTRAEAYLAQGVALAQRGRHGDAIGAYGNAIELEPNRADFYTALGVALLRLGRDKEAEKVCAHAITLDPLDATATLNLGIALSRLNRGGDAEPLLRRVLEIDQPPPAVSRGVAHLHLGFILIQRYEKDKQPDDLRLAARELAEAVRYPAPPDRLALRLAELGAVDLRLYQELKQVDALVPAIEASRGAMKAFAALGAIPPKLNAQLGCALRDLYVRDRHRELLEEALRELAAAVSGYRAAGEVGSDLATACTNLAATYSDRFRLDGNGADLHEAVDLIRSAVDMTSRDDPSRELREVNLAGMLLSLYNYDGNIDNLNEGIALNERRTQDLDSASGHGLSDLAGALKTRFLRLGDSSDLVRSVRLLELAVERPNPDQPRSGATAQSNLAEGLAMLAGRTSDPALATRAVEVATRAIEQTPTDDLAYPNRICQKGLALLTSYEIERRPATLDEAIVTLERALSEAERLPRFRSAAASRLASALGQRWRLDRADEDWEGAMRALRTGLVALPEGSPERPVFLDQVARLAQERFVRSKSPADLTVAIDALESAWDLLTGEFATLPMDFKLGSARRHANVPQRLLAAHLDAAQIERAGEGSRLHLRRAWEVAEGAKSRILTDYLTRVELPVPPGVPDALASRERSLLNRLQRLDALDSKRDSPTPSQAEEEPSAQPLADRAATRTELDRVWDEITACGPAGEAHVALRRPRRISFDSVRQRLEAQQRRTVVLSFCPLSDETVVMTATGGAQVPRAARVAWGDADWDELLERVAQELPMSRGEDRIPETWHTSVFALLAAVLDELLDAEHVIVLPVGKAMMVPWLVAFQRALTLHARNHRIAVSICPSAGALLSRPTDDDPPTTSPLVVGNPSGDLRHAQTEACAVATRLGVAPMLTGSALRSEVLPALGTASLVHLAAHGYFAPGKPLDSGLKMADAPLTARDVLGMRLRTGLVVLSACDTGIVEGLGGEEFAGLTQAFLSAGARSMIVSLWPVDDAATARLMEEFYDCFLAHGHVSPALCEAAERLRSTGIEHPYFWGAFTCVGGLEEA
jgi:tetratricopeptide (TPR) repeat protein